MRSSIKYVMLATVAMAGLAGTAEAAYSSNGGSTYGVAGSNYQTNSNYAQALGAAQANQNAQSGSSVYTSGYNGPNTGNTSMGGMQGQMPSQSMSASSQTLQGQGMQPGMSAGMSSGMGQPGMSRSGVLSDPQQIKSCLCLQTQYEMQQNDVSSKQAAYSQAMSQRAALDSQLAAAKAAGQSPAQLEQIRQTSLQRIEVQNMINQQYIPALQDATGRYDSTVASFQQSCGGKSYDTEVLSRVKTGLVCQGG